MDGLMEYLRAFPDSEVLMFVCAGHRVFIQNPYDCVGRGVELAHNDNPSQIISRDRSFEREQAAGFEYELV